MIYLFIHSLSEYINFLIQKELIAQTKRSKIVPCLSKEPLHGFFSSRSKREEMPTKYIRKNDTGIKVGFRCDSDRKITVEDEDLFAREINKVNRRESIGKTSQLKKIFK